MTTQDHVESWLERLLALAVSVTYVEVLVFAWLGI